MRAVGVLTVGMVSVLLLVLTAVPASAAEGPHTSCLVRESPLRWYKGEVWPQLSEKSATEWWLTGYVVNLTSAKKLGPPRGDHRMTVKLQTIDDDDAQADATHEVFSADVDPMTNVDNPLSKSVYPRIAVPRDHTVFFMQTWVELDRWPNHCETTGLPF